MTKSYKCLVYKPYEKGEVKELTFSQIRNEVGDYVESGFTNPLLSDKYIVYLHHEGMLINLPYCRGIHGIFVVLGRDEDEEVSLTDEEIKEIRNTLDNCTKKFNFPYVKENKISQTLENYFNELDLENSVYSFSDKGIYLELTTYQIIDYIGNIKEQKILEQILQSVMYCNFSDGNINDYVYFLGKQIAESRMKYLEKQYKGFI